MSTRDIWLALKRLKQNRRIGHTPKLRGSEIDPQATARVDLAREQDALNLSETKRLARRAAIRAGAPKDEVEVLDGLPANTNIYDIEGLGPYWCVFVPWGDGLDGRMLRSSRIILVSKLTGKVTYDGSANDEG